MAFICGKLLSLVNFIDLYFRQKEREISLDSPVHLPISN